MSAMAAISGFASSLQAPAFSPCRYWPCELLSEFTLQMAARGCVVNTSMMLGSREYAMQKLMQAQSMGDGALFDLSVRMAAYFHDEPCHAAMTMAGLAGSGSAGSTH